MSAATTPSPAQTLRGVFATETTTTVGFGATKRKVKQPVYVYAEEADGGQVACRPLSSQFIPLGEPRLVGREDLLAKFIPAPHIYFDKMLPALAALEQAVDSADRCREQGQFFTAEFEYKNALRLDENHIRASFGLGLTYLERGDAPNAHIVFRKLSRLSGVTAPEYKHLFNEFGIQLRKNGMHSQALGHYAKALRLSPDDDHLLYNIARALFEKGRFRAARGFLEKALTVRPDFPEAARFLEYLREQLSETITGSSIPAGSGPEGGGQSRQ